MAFLLVEVGLRILGISHPRFLETHDVLGSVHRPNVSFWQRDEGTAFVRFNSAGYHDRERIQAKPPGTVRIAVLGDSYVEALQVEQKQTITAVMERALNECGAFGDSTVEVLNFGVTGYGTAQEYLMLEEQVWAYEPDIVVVCFLTGNDFRNNCAALRRDPGRPYYVYENGELVMDTSFRDTFRTAHPELKKIVQGIIDRSRVAQMFYRAQSRAGRRRTTRERVEETQGAQVQDIGLDDQIYLPPADEAWEEAWKITGDLLLMIRDEVASRDARLAVVTLTNALQVDPDPVARQAAVTRLGASDLFYPDARIRSFCEEAGIPAVTLAPEMQKWAETRNVFLHGFENTRPGTGHWNAEGHRVAGVLAARDIDRLFGGGSCRGLEP